MLKEAKKEAAARNQTRSLLWGKGSHLDMFFHRGPGGCKNHEMIDGLLERCMLSSHHFGPHIVMLSKREFRIWGPDVHLNNIHAYAHIYF